MRRPVAFAYIDLQNVIICLLIAFIFILVRMHERQPQTETMAQPGSVIVEIRWADGLDTDVDLWILAPGDNPVGYLNKAGRVFDLLRDDLGKYSDLGGLNFENAYTRGLPAGEYVVNVELFSNNANLLPVHVDILVAIRVGTQGGETRKLFVGAVDLTRIKQEMTILRFALSKDGSLVPGSMNSLQTSLHYRSS